MDNKLKSKKRKSSIQNEVDQKKRVLPISAQDNCNDKLPNEILLKIFQLISVKDLCRVSLYDFILLFLLNNVSAF